MEHLKDSAEFRRVYEHGRRYDSQLITIFVLRNDLNFHRLGVTASRKMARGAVERNRAKRLLREAFRLSGDELNALQFKYDWVFNARRHLLEGKVFEPLKEFREIITRVSRSERESS